MNALGCPLNLVGWQASQVNVLVKALVGTFFHRCCVASAVCCSYISDGAFRCSLYLSSKVLADSPI